MYKIIVILKLNSPFIYLLTSCSIVSSSRDTPPWYNTRLVFSQVYGHLLPREFLMGRTFGYPVHFITWTFVHWIVQSGHLLPKKLLNEFYMSNICVNFSPDDCVLGDQPGQAFNDLTCADLTRTWPAYCYQEKVRARCCRSCAAIHTGNKGNTYGELW